LKNVVLIGMPSSGKTTVGKRVANILGLQFKDTDALISSFVGKTPAEIVRESGRERFLKIQEEAVCKIKGDNQVIATGGSMVLCKKCMDHLKKEGITVFLKTDYNTMLKRLTPERKLARDNNQSLHGMYTERLPLYQEYADIVIDCSRKKVDEIIDELIDACKDEGFGIYETGI